ncbi:protein SSUH2 homolog, partial [Xyrichtys novacula]
LPASDISNAPQNVSQDEGTPVPTPDLPEQNLQPDPATPLPEWNLVSVSKEDAQQAFIRYAAGKRCYSKRAAEQAVITNMEAFNTHRYRLETFTETRTTKMSVSSFFGQPIDNDGQPPPDKWDIQVTAPPLFQEESQTVSVPNTEAVTECVRCDWDGKTSCHICHSSGRWSAFLSFRIRVRLVVVVVRSTCLVTGGAVLAVVEPDGEGEFEILKNNKDEVVVEQSSELKLPGLDEVSGRALSSTAALRVDPVSNFPQPDVVKASERLLTAHRQRFPHPTRILQQRQTIEELPITKVTYKWRGKSHVFFVYGTEHKVNAEDYPAACCCCNCSV